MSAALDVLFYFALLIVADGDVICNSVAECGVYAVLTGSGCSHCAVVSIHSSLLLKICKRDKTS